MAAFDEPALFRILVMAVFLSAGVTFVALGTVAAPYGRHARPGWGPGIPVRLGWMVMEAPAVAVFALVFFAGPRAHALVPRIFLVLWMAHYVHRTFVYPLTTRGQRGKLTPIVVVVLGVAFNGVNGYLNGRSLTALGPEYPTRWMIDIRFLYGVVLFITGFIVNRWADLTLRALRRPGDSDYRIPRGGLFDEISCPNYFGELMMWTGWAIATWSIAGWAFAVFSAANLIPRAVSHHRWYRRTFRDYPRRRKAIIPFVL